MVTGKSILLTPSSSWSSPSHVLKSPAPPIVTAKYGELAFLQRINQSKMNGEKTYIKQTTLRSDDDKSN
ncbi:hypothetical protein HanIR_Chr00c29g0911871 [Helianthus annuus]|nr:hypothetical protein HanIR_Chr00c29g0911871 [Helianthus annuus]